MAKKNQRSVSSRRKEHQARQKRQRLLIGILAVAAVVIVAGVVYWVRQSRSPANSVILPASVAPPANADGSAWGPPDAPVLVEEFSDFQ